MTDKKPYLVNLKPVKDKDLSKGIGGPLAQKMARSQGSRFMVVAEIEVGTIHKAPDQDLVDLVVTQFWPAEDTILDDHLRGITRTLHRQNGFNAAAADGQQQLPLGDQGSEPTVEGVVAAGGRFRPHPYIASTLSTDDNSICDVCGLLADAAPHQAHELDADPDTAPTETGGLAEPGEGDGQGEVLEDHPDNALDGADGDDEDDDQGDDEQDDADEHREGSKPADQPADQPTLTAVPGEAPARPAPTVNPFAPVPGTPGPGGDVA